MQKRGKVTIFLVVGIVILLIVAGSLFLFSNLQKKEIEVKQQQTTSSLGIKGSVQSFVESCMEETLEPPLYLLAQQGGIIYPDESTSILLTDHGMINYAWLNGMDGLSRKKMEEDLATYVEEYISFCVGKFETFTRQGIVIEPDYDRIKGDVTVSSTQIKLDLIFPLSITLPNKDVTKLETFSVSTKSNLGKIVNDVENLDFPDIDPVTIFDLPYTSVILPYDESVAIYALHDQESNQPLNFMFAVRNDFPDNSPPVLESISDKSFTVGDIWQEELLAKDVNNDILKFSSNSNKFPVNEDGIIDVEIKEKGIFDVTFTVTDGRGGEDKQKISILVLE